jgi:Domain of unknown function (DUF4136)
VKTATLIGTVGLLWSTMAAAQDVSYDYDKTANFATLTTYAWAKGTPVGDELNHQRIVSAVDSQLAAKGVHQVESVANADLLVTYHAVITQDVEVTGTRVGLSRWGSARATQVPVGGLVLTLMDAKTHAVVWRGVASRDLDVKASPEQREKNINKAVEKLFKHYPPTK